MQRSLLVFLRIFVPLFLGLSACAGNPPVQEMSDARQAIAAAEEADAGELAPQSLNEARRYLDEAQRQLQDEAFEPARMNAVRARNRAVRAIEVSQQVAQRTN
jgi:hypothetical protein